MKQQTEYRCPHGRLIGVGGWASPDEQLPEIEGCDECPQQPGRARALDLLGD